MNFRKFSKYICALSLAAMFTINTMAATIIDVASNHWAYKAVTDLANRGIMVPTSTGEFRPNQLMNYFEVADVLAKATGYVDVDVATNIDPVFKEQIQNNYERQKAVLATYAAKYSTWDKSYDKQVAYLLGRGYMSVSDLDKFITKSTKSETRNIMTKEELAVFVVRLIGKENTAKNTYKTTGFNDEKNIKESYRPHVAYLKSIGVINGTGSFNPATKVTKALCAKMVDDALVYKEKTQNNGSNNNTNNGSNNENNNSNSNSNNGSSNGTDTGVQTPVGEVVKVNRVLRKNDSEYYVSLIRNSNASYYTIKNTTKVIDAEGNEISVTNIPVGTQARVVIEVQGGTEYIVRLQLIGSDPATPTPPVEENSDTTSSSTVTGSIVGSVGNGVLRVTTAEGNVKTYLLQDDCKITLNGASVTVDKLSKGDTVTLTVKNDSMVTKVVAKTTSSSQESGNGALTAKKISEKGYVLTLKQNNGEEAVTIPKDATIKRNDKTIDGVQELRIGDTIKVTKKNNEITLVEATGARKSVTGIIKEINLSQTPRIVVNVNDEAITYVLASDAELYDGNDKKYIGIRDLHLGQEVSIIADSKEIISLDVQKTDTSVKMMGTILSVSRNNDYIDVFVDYDPITGDNKVYKRIELSNDVAITLNGKVQSQNVLEEDMEILIIYKYLDDKMPQKIQII